MDFRPTSASLAWFLLLALALHGLVFLLEPWILKGLGPLAALAPKQPKQFIIDRVPDLESDKPVVQTSRARHQDLSDDKKAKYAGEFRNRVEKQTQSSRRGRFQQGTLAHQGQGGTGEIPQIDQPNGEAGEKTPPPGPSMRDLLALSSSPNAMERDIEQGDETVINTDQVIYASFINRIADEIYDPWVQHVREAFENITFNGRKVAPAMYVTRLNVLMDASGTVTAIKVLESSGIPELDEAPKKAFWEREPFPNPPEQMFGKDGIVRFVYEFKVDNKTSFFNILPWST